MLLAIAPCGAVESTPENQESVVAMSFDDVRIQTLVKYVADRTGLRITIDPEIAQRVTFQTPDVPLSEVYGTLVSVLEQYGFTMAEQNGVHTVKALPEGGGTGKVILPEEDLPAAGLVTRMFQLKHVSASALRKALEAKVRNGKAGGIASIDETNHLMITDTVSSVREFERIIEELDREGATQQMEVYHLEHADSREMAMQLNEAMLRQVGRAENLRNRFPQPAGNTANKLEQSVAIVDVQHSNSLILVGPPQKIKDVQAMIVLMDVEPKSGRGRLKAIFLDHLLAEEAAKELTALISQKVAKDGTVRQIGQRIAIEASLESNALLIDASASDYAEISSLIEALDTAPKQVLLEVMLVEHSLSDRLDVGVSLAVLDTPAAVGDTVVSGSSFLKEQTTSLLDVVENGIFPRGLTVAVAHGSSTDADGNVVASFPGIVNINALQEDGTVKILSNTLLPAKNNREASLNIVKNIPILSSTIQGGTGTQRDVIQNIERMDVGIKLKLTAHINPNDIVNMEINTSIEAIIEGGSGDLAFTPTIAKRDVTTTVSVPDGQTIVLSGLVREDEIERVSKIPILGSIPFLGHLFRNTFKDKERLNLMIFVTPTVIDSVETADEVKARWERRTKLLQSEAEAVADSSEQSGDE